jgi:hypothetical protein
MSNCVKAPGFSFADSVIASPHPFSRARIFFQPVSRLHAVFVALVHEGGKELRAQGASAQDKRLTF